MKFKKDKGICYLCGKEGFLTDDHIPPKCLSPKSPDTSFFHAGACGVCNNKLSHEESVLRDLLATSGSKKGNRSADEAFEKAMSNFKRGLIKSGGRHSKDLTRIALNIKRKNVITKSGIVLGEMPFLYPPEDIKTEKVLIKIAKGVHYQVYKEVIPPNYNCFGKYLQNKIKLEELNIVDKLPYEGSAGDFFNFKGGAPNDDRKSGFWYLSFYSGSIMAIVTFLPPKTN